MDNRTPISLEQVLVSYNILIIIVFIFIILMLVLMSTNKAGFNKLFGYEIFVTAPFIFIIAYLIKEIFAFKNNPQSSLFSSFSQSNETWFIPVISLITVFIGILGFFMVLYVGGIFSDSPPENNIAMISNFIIIVSFLIIASVIYNNYKKKDDNTLSTLPKSLQDAFSLRTKYTFMFVLFVLFVSLLYFVNPWNVMSNYGGPVVFFSLFVGIILVIMITIYQQFLANPTKINNVSPFTFASKGLYILASLGISFGLIYGALKMMGVFEQDASKPETWGHTLFNFVLFCTMLGIIYKLANAGGFLDKNPYYRLVLNTILYIPCLLVTFTSYFSSSQPAFAPPKPFEIKMLVLSLVLLGAYFIWVLLAKKYIVSSYLKQGGKQLINQPVTTDVLTNVTTYQSLSGDNTFNYQYAMSFWLYLDAFPPNTHNKIVPILSYGQNPAIKYSATNNTLYITVKQDTEDDKLTKVGEITEIDIAVNEWKSVVKDAIETVKSIPFGNETDAEGHRIIYKQPDVQLQKWNHILLNYNGGTLDVFYNGKLVKSAIEVVPYIKYDMLTVGSENGVSGNIANLMYFDKPLDLLTINTLYSSLKNTNPPVISENREKIIPV